MSTKSSIPSLVFLTVSALCMTLLSCGGTVEAGPKIPVGEGIGVRPQHVEFEATVVAATGTRRIAAPDPSARPRVARLEIMLGQEVTLGDVLAVLDGLTEAQLDLEVARSKLKRAEIEVEIAGRPFDKDSTDHPLASVIGKVAASVHERDRLRTIAEEHRLEVRRKELDVDRLRVRAPLSGRIVAIHAYPGESVSPESGLCEITPSAREVVADVAPLVAQTIDIGAHALFRLPRLEAPLEGRVIRIEDFRGADTTKIVAIFEGSWLTSHLGEKGHLRIESKPRPVK
ncbi:MAG: efflux RND transporter periplasmic adaptor subunit [Planctomycetes bacterium]|nr:efflux RND transporter periplasmic adaptor subunit [Planctomycetota bacterium]MCB9892629.1 efflux RND transporter periplasmic adaptor subunit [Planctomycetota bacterium]MCB9917549.1 efflux RND transporter periplasmic adaptor subunit [Planctomycetota bacterium]